MPLSDNALLSRAKSLVAEETSATARVIECLEEIERRRLYLERGYPSLLAFAVEFLGYSEPSALRRIAAMRLVRDVPALKPAVESGALSLTTLTQAQRFFRAEKKVYSADEKKGLVLSLKNLSTREIERTLTTKNPDFARKEILRPTGSSQTEVRFLADETLLQDLKRIQSLMALGTIEETVAQMAKLTLKKIDPAAQEDKKQKPVNPDRRLPSTTQRRAVFRRDQTCAYQDRRSGRRCGSAYGLEVDHRQPYAMGGKTVETNLRLLCRAHHRHVTRQVFPEIRRSPSAPKVSANASEKSEAAAPPPEGTAAHNKEQKLPRGKSLPAWLGARTEARATESRRWP